MVCEMDNMPIEEMEEMDIEALPSMWPEDIVDDTGDQFKIEGLGGDQDMLEEVTIRPKPSSGDLKRLSELFYTTDHGSAQLETLAKHWQYRHANAVRLLREELDILSRKKQEIELKKLEIIEEHRFEEERYCGDKRPISILDDLDDILMSVRKKHDITIQSKRVEIEAEYDTAVYWKQRAMQLESLLDASMQREQILMEKLQESIQNLEGQSTPLEELQQIMQRADNYLHFILKHAPVVIGHQDKELRYRFIYNHFPTLQDDDILGKTDMEIFTGSGVKESQEFKREVLEKGLPAKREITFETELFGSKTFLIYVEPVFSKSGETIGINYMGMDVTDQVIKREKMAKLREEIAVQKAKETELNKTIHITEETMRAKQMLATMSHEIRSPLSGVVSMAEILSNTKLDHEQRQLIDVMISSGDHVLKLINDILDLSKVESGVMKLEATKFRPREVVKHVLQTAAASLQKMLTLEGHVADNVPVEVIGDVLRIRQILTNLISNAVKFTHEGKVAIDVYVVEEPSTINGEEFPQNSNVIRSENILKEEKHSLPCQRDCKPTATEGGSPGEEDEGESHVPDTVWICCDVRDTGIGIPENALPTLFKKYMQVSADHARKYGGTGLGLAICKQLVELMGGRLTVTSTVNCGSTFTFILPYKVSPICDDSDDSDELGDMASHDKSADDVTEGFFQFQPRSLGSLFSTNGASRTPKLLPQCVGYSSSQKLNGFAEDSYMFPNKNIRSKETASPEDACSIVDAVETLSESECSLNQSPHPLNGDVMGKGKESGEDKYLRTKEFGFNLTDQPRGGGGEMNGLANGVPPKAGLTVEASDTRSDCLSSNKPQVSNTKSNPKILLVEDNKVNVMVTRSMMKQLGHKMDVVNNGVEAVRAVQKCSYDLILMDVCMPVMDGLQATRLIRSFEETGNWDDAVKAGIEQPSSQEDLVANDDGCMKSRKRVPIIAMTANALSESEDECFANGMDSFVSKPVTFQNLKQCLEQYLQ